jgi:hypothetical protein
VPVQPREAQARHARDLRSALYCWAFNFNRWTDDPSAEVARILSWVEGNTMPVSALDDPLVMRKG